MSLPDDVVYVPDFIPKHKECFEQLSKLTWHRHQIPMFGKKIPAPRQFAWMGTPPRRVYGDPIPITPWTTEIELIREQLKNQTSIEFDSLNINYYANGSDYIGWHIDPEDEGKWEYPIASISLGSCRKFQMRQYVRAVGKGRVSVPDTTASLELSPGSLLIMPPQFQAKWEHRLPKVKESGPRINLTFRKMK